MSSVIQFDKVSKRFTLSHDRPRSLQETVIRFLDPRRKQGQDEEFWALRNVSFDIQRGQTVGLIGTNGSGKSTALKLMSGILQPTSGAITVDGRISALLELGSGMHPDLTGRENVFLNGSLLGLSNSEIHRIYPEILEFSELERFIDMPVKHYSSGMYMRLGFSIAIHVQPDILLLDEVLAVGDQSFQTKCLDHIYTMKRRGTTIVMVSHGLDSIQSICDEVVWLKDSELKRQGPAGELVEEYLFEVHAGMQRGHFSSAGTVEAERRTGSGEIEIVAVRLLNGRGEQTNTFLTGDTLTVEMDYLAHIAEQNPLFGLAITRADGTHINGPNNRLAGLEFGLIEGTGTVRYTIPNLPLMQGYYDITTAVYDRTSTHAFDVHNRAYHFQIHAGGTPELYGLVSIPGEWKHLPSALDTMASTGHPEPVLARGGA